MSDGDRRDRYSSLVALAAILGVVIVAWFSQPSDNHVGQPYANPLSSQDNDGQPIAKRVYWGLFTADDTFAQWLMAFFGFVATVVSIWAVILVRRTLDANNRAFADEKRAWISVNFRSAKIAYIQDGEVGFNVTVLIKNIGSTPARNVITDMEMIDHKLELHEEVKAIANKDNSVYERFSKILMPSESYTREWTFSLPIDGEYMQPVVIGCTNYRTFYDSEIHKTAFAISISEDNPDLDGYHPIRTDPLLDRTDYSIVGEHTAGGFAT